MHGIDVLMKVSLDIPRTNYSGEGVANCIANRGDVVLCGRMGVYPNVMVMDTWI